ncbi:hypothetical protein ACIA5C_22685 [Actinoplanes sp. NPDC051343]|uniref:hypothetical protein n=1 Tax=Actinoplanes sp. NPDC051343 TaxID=3363906 RepID=UPI00379B1EC1
MPPIAAHLRPDTVLCPDSLESALLDAIGTGEHVRHVPVLGRRGELPDDLRRPALGAEARASAVPLDAVGAIDAEAVAGWIVERYPEPHYPAVLLGSPHGSAVHLTAAMRGAWLPTSFTVRVPWPGGHVGDWRGAGEAGRVVAGRITAANPAVSVRQVHDPILDGPLCAATITLHVRWRELPTAYENFLRSRLRPGAMSLVFRDVRTWPVLDLGGGHTLQVGSPVTGLTYDQYDIARPAFRKILRDLGPDEWSRPGRGMLPRYAERAGEPALEPQLREVAAEAGHRAHRVLYRGPAALSAVVADLHRESEPSGGSCLIETDRLVDPQGVLRRGIVPYWCESAAGTTVAAAEQWLAGSRPFARVAVLPSPPGTVAETHAGLGQWRSLSTFAERGGWVDRQAAGRYPRLPLARSSAVRMTAETGPAGRPAPPMSAERVLAGLRRQGPLLGMFVG